MKRNKTEITITRVELDPSKSGKRIKAIRKDRGLTVVQVAKYLDISTRALFAIESGSHYGELSNLYNMSRLYQVNMQELFVEKE